MAVVRKIVCGTAIGAVIYGHWVRPRLWRWGATDDEVAGPYPGADLVPEGERAATMAVTIDVPPQRAAEREGTRSRWERPQGAGSARRLSRPGPTGG